MMPQLIYILDLVGTFAFAVLGASAGMKKRFDIFGILMAGFLTAFAGGTLREVLLGGLPPYFKENSYVLAAILGVAFAVLFFRDLPRIGKYILAMDALGLAVFAVIGASRAATEGLGTFAIIFIATLTAVGGGLVRDAVLTETPRIFYKDFYATPAIIAGALYALFRDDMSILGIYTLITAIFFLRMAAMRYNWVLWRPGGRSGI